MTPTDDDITPRFEAMRRVDAAAVPQLDALLARPASHRRRRLALPVAVAAAAMIVLAVGIRYSASRTPITPTIEASILAWRSPTASLLHLPGNELLHTVPTLKSSLLRGTSPSL